MLRFNNHLIIYLVFSLYLILSTQMHVNNLYISSENLEIFHLNLDNSNLIASMQKNEKKKNMKFKTI